MTKETYLRFLRAYLSNRLPAGEVEDIMGYYTEYFEDAGEGHEAEVMAELGSPEQLAQQILSDRGQEEPGPGAYTYAPQTEDIPPLGGGMPQWAFALLLVLAAVFAGPVLLGLVAGLGIGGVICVAVGLRAVLGGMRLSIAGLLYQVGGGLIAAAVGLLLILGAILAVRLVVWLIHWFRDAFVERGAGYEDNY